MLNILKSIFTKTGDGTTERLVQFSAAYFVFYVITGYLAKHFDKVLGVSDIQYTFYNTIGGMLICNAVVLLWGWYKFKSSQYMNLLGLKMPKEFLFIIPSGICTAIIIPTTTLMYTLPISVMVAMIIMRASVIVISRFIDEAQIRQGILNKKVYWEENIAVIFALFAVSIKFFYVKAGDFNFLGNAAAVTILVFYLTAYTIRLYIMNYYKNTLPKNAVYDTKGFFAIEQISSTVAIIIAGFIFFKVTSAPAANPYTPREMPSLSLASNKAEKENLLNQISETNSLLEKSANKFSDSQRSDMESAIDLGLAELKKPAYNKELADKTAAEMEKTVKAVKKTFAYKFSSAIETPTEKWFATIMSGIPFGLAAFFSVFLFMFKGRTATFAGLVNRLTSLVAGTTATIVVYLLIKGQKPPQNEDWLSLFFILVAIYFMGRGEKKRACELLKAKEIETAKNC